MGLRSLAFGRGGDRCRVGKKRRDNAAKQTRFSKGRPMCDGNVVTERRSAVGRIQGGGGEIEWQGTTNVRRERIDGRREGGQEDKGHKFGGRIRQTNNRRAPGWLPMKPGWRSRQTNNRRAPGWLPMKPGWRVMQRAWLVPKLSVKGTPKLWPRAGRKREGFTAGEVGVQNEGSGAGVIGSGADNSCNRLGWKVGMSKNWSGAW